VEFSSHKSIPKYGEEAAEHQESIVLLLACLAQLMMVSLNKARIVVNL
jgi:hypothetical protein